MCDVDSNMGDKGASRKAEERCRFGNGSEKGRHRDHTGEAVLQTDLGTSLGHLQVLWLARCGLADLDGISSFPALKELYLSYNDIWDLSPLCLLEQLEVLDLEGNCVEDLGQLRYLQLCPRLATLTLEGNPLCLWPGPGPTHQVPRGYNYRAEVRKLIPQLQVLDELPAAHTGLPASRKLDQDWFLVKEAIKEGCILDSLLPRPDRTHGSPMWSLSPELCLPETQPRAPRRWPLSLLAPGVPLTEGLLPKGPAPEDDASNLTHGTGRVLCGNPTKGLQERRHQCQAGVHPEKLPLPRLEELAPRASAPGPDPANDRDLLASAGLQALRELHLRAERPCPAMDDDSLEELVDRSPGPDGHPRLCPAALASDAEGGSDAHSGASEDDSGSEHSDEEDADGDLEDGSGSEDSEEDGDDMDTLAAVTDTQGTLEAGGAFNSDDDSESCPICLNAFREQAVGTPENCAHYFCLDCIVEWSKIPVESAQLGEDEDEDPTFCEVCGRSDREDRLLLCDGCDAGYHMECLDPPLQEVPVDEWFCPECAAPGAASAADTGPVSEEEVSLLLADVVPTTSRLRPRTGRTRAIARTRQSERVRATVNRNRISTARRFQRVPRYLVSSLLDETIEAVAAGLSTAVYQRPGPRAPARRRRKGGRRKKASGRKKAPSRSSAKSRGSGPRLKKRLGRVKKRKAQKIKNEATARSRIARTLGLCGPARGACTPSVYKPADPSLGLMRADIGAASLSLFGDPYELDPFDSGEEASASPASPLSAKRRVLSRSALRSHQPVARPVSMGLSRRSAPTAAPQLEVDAEPSPDLLGSILSGQSLLMMNGADIVIHRDGSLSAKKADLGPSGFQGGVGLAVEGRLGHTAAYMKKLHVQERAVEEVKLAIKPFYQKREVTKDEYKDILRKAVQKICHSKSGEINPVKVGNLVKAYVDKYRHMRRHRRAEAGEEPPAQGAEG
ncbi:hypothetical protein G4228_001286 [Cervus hanglu yarkandensis]|nr:hypothetical protein G4228_001286 [Cervus hanglu yarkandensis]